jgi:hypothetical protein
MAILVDSKLGCLIEGNLFCRAEFCDYSGSHQLHDNSRLMSDSGEKAPSVKAADAVQERHFRSAERFLEALLPWKVDKPDKVRIYRGQAHDLPLLPSALRDNGKKLWPLARIHNVPEDEKKWEHNFIDAEFRLLQDFFRRSDKVGLSLPASDLLRENLHDIYVGPWGSEAGYKRLKCWPAPELVEVAALAQHYGLPTRLLDWSYDPFVAAFFSFRDAINEIRRHGKKEGQENLVVWELDTFLLRLPEVNTGEGIPLRIVTPPYWQNANLAAQRGVFTYWEKTLDLQVDGHLQRIRNPGDDNLKADFTPLDVLVLSHHQKWPGRKEWFVKYTLPLENAEEGYNLLRRLGYDHARMFPGFGGVANEMHFQLETF